MGLNKSIAIVYLAIKMAHIFSRSGYSPSE